MGGNSNYRSEIDGLRAIAVFSVLLFHVDISWAQGGFVGVDVFFVISGYLITNNILNGLNSNNFSLKTFYQRRFWRLMPALFFTLFCVYVSAFILFPVDEFVRVSKTVLYSALSVSNFFFWGESGYFETASEAKPLLHTWSLAIEEQFYLLWPSLLLLLFAFKNKKVLPAALFVMGLGSLFLSQYWALHSPLSSFFLLPARVFEFCLGAACVWAMRKPLKGWLEELVLLAGLSMIAWSILTFSHDTVFPGYKALIPCIGTVMVIYAGRANMVGKLLQNRLAIGLGLVSYSTYLAHWPLIVFYKHGRIAEGGLTPQEQVVLLALSILLGILMWKLVETRFRYPRTPESRRSVNRGLIASCVLLLSLSVLTQYNGGWPQRFAYQISVEDIENERNRYWKTFKGDLKTLTRNPDSDEEVILMGDSHGIDLFYALKKNGFDKNITWLPTKGCYDFRRPVKENKAQACADQVAHNLSHPALKTANALYLHERWAKHDADDLAEFLLMLREETDAPIFLFGPKMIFSKKIPVIIHNFDDSGDGNQADKLNSLARRYYRLDEVLSLNNSLEDMFKRYSLSEKNILWVNTLKIQCGEVLEDCQIISPSTSSFLYFDSDHFSAEGAREYGQKLRTQHPYLF